MLEIELYYGVEHINDLNVWARQFNISAREMALVILGQKARRLTAGFCLETGLAEQSMIFPSTRCGSAPRRCWEAFSY